MSDKFEKNLIEQIKKEKENLKGFSNSEKGLLKERVMRYAKENPARKPLESFKISLYSRVLVPALSVFLIFGGVGISAAAEGSLPGDFLYPIKVSVNEVVREAFSLSDKARQEWKIRQIERRFEEVEYLETRGEVDNNKKEIIQERLANHIESLDNISDKFERKGEIENAESVYLELETALEPEAREEAVVATVFSRSESDASTSLRTRDGVETPKQDRVLESYLSQRKEEARIRALFKRVKTEISDENLVREIEKRLEKLREAIREEDQREYQRILRELNRLLRR